MSMDGIKTVSVKIKGISPLLMHNSQLANPHNEWVRQMKEITSKHHTKITEDDRIELMRLEFQGGLYYDDKIGPYLPDTNVEATIKKAANAKNKGKTIESGLQVNPTYIPLVYDGPKDRHELYADTNFIDFRAAKLKGNSTIMRTRPRFDNWSCEFEVMVISEILNVSDVENFLIYAGKLIGLCDYRPKFGRFEVDKFKVN